MPLNLVQFLPDLFGWHEWVVEMALLEFVVAGEEGSVVVEGFDFTYVLATAALNGYGREGEGVSMKERDGGLIG